MNSSSYNQTSESVNLSPLYTEGEEIMIGGETLRVTAVAGRGRRSIVYQVDDRDGRRLALKIPVDREPDTLNSLKNEELKARAYSRYGFKHAGVIETGPDYILKEWVDGIRGDRWTREWAEEGFPPDAPQIIQLGELIRHSAAKKIYLRDLNQNNLIWDGDQWVIIDTGSVKKRLFRSRIIRLYREYI
ncbi:MAG TPA: hypothetical protein ENH12_01395, partial [Proteobacteria bacterium]|nr:hypothetical protein [Pseudomonadota bacterium]